MKIILITLFVFLLLLFFLVILLSLLRTMYIQHGRQQKEFLGGKVPQELPDGFYKGTVGALKTSWQGKRFDRVQTTGINVFQGTASQDEKYPFRINVGAGIQDKNLQVIKIDYSGNKDPWWLKYILDEIVEVSPGTFLGKVHVTIMPGVPLSLGYFRLEK